METTRTISLSAADAERLDDLADAWECSHEQAVGTALQLVPRDRSPEPLHATLKRLAERLDDFEQSTTPTSRPASTTDSPDPRESLVTLDGESVHLPELDSETCLDPDQDVDVKQSKRICRPALQGLLRGYACEHSSSVSDEELLNLVMEWLDIGAQAAQQYIDDLQQADLILADPIYDPRLPDARACYEEASCSPSDEIYGLDKLLNRSERQWHLTETSYRHDAPYCIGDLCAYVRSRQKRFAPAHRRAQEVAFRRCVAICYDRGGIDDFETWVDEIR